MEGPATTSALIHAATLVLAGQYVLVLFYDMIQEISDDSLNYRVFQLISGDLEADLGICISGRTSGIQISLISVDFR
eukprot:gene26484-biopygen341